MVELAQRRCRLVGQRQRLVFRRRNAGLKPRDQTTQVRGDLAVFARLQQPRGKPALQHQRLQSQLHASGTTRLTTPPFETLPGQDLRVAVAEASEDFGIRHPPGIMAAVVFPAEPFCTEEHEGGPPGVDKALLPEILVKPLDSRSELSEADVADAIAVQWPTVGFRQITVGENTRQNRLPLGCLLDPHRRPQRHDRHHDIGLEITALFTGVGSQVLVDLFENSQIRPRRLESRSKIGNCSPSVPTIPHVPPTHIDPIRPSRRHS